MFIILISVYWKSTKTNGDKIIQTQNCRTSITVKEVVILLSRDTGIGQNTIQTIIADYRNAKPIQSPNKKKNRLTFKEKVDDFERNAIRKEVYDFLLSRQVPTLDKILISVNNDPILNTYKRTNLYHSLRKLNFTYCKRGRNSALIERDDIVLWRTKYVQDTENIAKKEDQFII